MRIVQRAVPAFASTATKRPSYVPKKTVPLVTAGEEAIGECASYDHSFVPFVRSIA